MDDPTPISNPLLKPSTSTKGHDFVLKEETSITGWGSKIIPDPAEKRNNNFSNGTVQQGLQSGSNFDNMPRNFIEEKPGSNHSEPQSHKW